MRALFKACKGIFRRRNENKLLALAGIERSQHDAYRSLLGGLGDAELKKKIEELKIAHHFVGLCKKHIRQRNNRLMHENPSQTALAFAYGQLARERVRAMRLRAKQPH